MSQAVITKAFSEWKAQQAIDNKPVTLDEFIFAYIPGLNVDLPVSNTETIPAADKIVHRQAVSKAGVVNGNSVVYSVTLGADVGDFNFNWIGLANKASGTLAMIIHAPTQSKIKNASGQQGNVLVRSMLMEYSGAQAATNITTPAETWQIDFTARLAAMDERQRLENVDIYGAAAFFDTGYLVSKTGSQFFVTKGAGYVAGLRSELAANQNITVSTKPVKVWLDVAWSGTLTSEWKIQSKITVAASLTDYAESNVQHHVFALASIDASGNITDLRPKGSLNDQAASDAMKAHEQSRNHPDGTTTAKGFVQLSSETGSDSESKAATPKGVKAAFDLATKANANAETRLLKAENLADVPDKTKARAALLLGSSAVKDVVSSTTDTTPGRVPDVGWQGLGAVSGPGYTDANTPNVNCYFRMNAAGIHGPVAGAPSNIHQFQYDANAGQQIGYRAGVEDAAMYHRTKINGVWGNWSQVFDTLHPPTASQVDAVSASKGGEYAGAVTFNGALITKSAVEIYGATPYIDFHFNNSTADYTSRIFEENSGTLKVIGNWAVSGTITPGSYTNFDGRFYTKTLADAIFQPKGSYSAPDTAGESGGVLWWKNTATGVITMMGATASVANSGRVTFPFAFPTKCFGVIPTRNNSTGNGAAMQPYDVDQTGWNLRIAGGGTETVMWTAAGK